MQCSLCHDLAPQAPSGDGDVKLALSPVDGVTIRSRCFW